MPGGITGANPESSPFIAAQAVELCLIVKRLSNHCGQLAQQFIALRVTQRIVVLLEKINIDQDQPVTGAASPTRLGAKRYDYRPR